LTDRGRRQSAVAAESLRGRDIVALYTSDLARARETADIVATALGLSVQCDSALRERCFGVYEGRPSSSLDPADTGIRGDRVVDTRAHPEGGESLDDVYRRVGTFVERLRTREPAGDVIVVTHGGAIRALRAYCERVPLTGMTWDDVPNNGLYGMSRWGSAHSSKCQMSDHIIRRQNGGNTCDRLP
jgi:probable phosphoglycerate mutase